MRSSPKNDAQGRQVLGFLFDAKDNRTGQAGLVFAVALGLAACGGGKPSESKLPEQPVARPAPTFVPPTTPGGPQYAVSDTPTMEDASARPKMNAAAAQAYSAGLAAFQAGDLQGARTQFTRATEADANAFQAHYSLGVVRERLGEAGALTSYSRAVSIVADYEPAIAAYGILLARQGKTAEAAEYLGGKLGRLPKSAAVPAALAEVKSLEGDSGSAQRLAREALKKNPDFRPAMVTIARDHYRKRRLDLALYSLKAILDGFGPENPARDPNNAEARLIRGLIYKEQANRRGAIEDFQKALALRPDLVEARVHLAAYLLEAGNAPEAADLLQAALKYDKEHLLARLNLGDAYRLLGKNDDSKKELEWVLGKDPALPQVHYNLGLLYLFADSMPGMTPRQQVDKAIAELEKYKELRPRAKGSTDDIDELLTRAKTKRGVIDAEKTQPPPSAATPPPGGAKPAGAAPAGDAPAGGSPAPTGPSSGALPPPDEKPQGEKK
jgi:Tfp pilus assembly protein PilF